MMIAFPGRCLLVSNTLGIHRYVERPQFWRPHVGRPHVGRPQGSPLRKNMKNTHLCKKTPVSVGATLVVAQRVIAQRVTAQHVIAQHVIAQRKNEFPRFRHQWC